MRSVMQPVVWCESDALNDTYSGTFFSLSLSLFRGIRDSGAIPSHLIHSKPSSDPYYPAGGIATQPMTKQRITNIIVICNKMHFIIDNVHVTIHSNYARSICMANNVCPSMPSRYLFTHPYCPLQHSNFEHWNPALPKKEKKLFTCFAWCKNYYSICQLVNICVSNEFQ